MVKKKTLVAASLLGADHGRLSSEASELANAGADMIHLDVMDGLFVPALTFGAGVAAAVVKSVDIPVDAHLMVRDPVVLINSFARAGCTYITVHVEATPHLDRLLGTIREKGCRAGVALNPATSPDFLKYIAPALDMVLVMTVNPGFAGQDHLEYVHPKISEVRNILDAYGGRDALLSVDGGVTSLNAGILVSLGADVLVSGSYVTGAASPAEAIGRLR